MTCNQRENAEEQKGAALAKELRTTKHPFTRTPNEHKGTYPMKYSQPTCQQDHKPHEWQHETLERIQCR